MNLEVEMTDTTADDDDHSKLQRAIEQLDRKLARKLILHQGVKPSSTIKPTQLLRFLQVAVESRDPLLVAKLLEQKPNINNPIGGQILWIVVEDGNTEIATMLVHAGVDLNERSRGRNFIHALSSSIDPRKHRLLLLMIDHRNVNVNIRDFKGNTALYHAVRWQSTQLVADLLTRGAVIEDNVVTLAASRQNADELVPMLIASHVHDLTTRDRQAISAIMYLITKGDKVEIIKKLLDIGVPVDLVNISGWTSLVFATIFERVRVVELLLNYGADVNRKSENGVLPLYTASGLDESTISKIFISKGADIHAQNEIDRQYAIHAACANESLPNIHLLLSLGADMNVVDKSDRTPFSLMDTAESLNHPIKHVIKHLALTMAKHSTIHKLDLTIIYESSHTQTFYESCLDELGQMKIVKIYNDISFFSIIQKNTQELSSLMRNSDFVRSYNNSPTRSLFPIYFTDMSIAFRNSELRKNILVFQENSLNKIMNKNLPDIAIRKIAYYLCMYDLNLLK